METLSQSHRRTLIENWVRENPNGYLEKTFKAIADEIGIGAGSVHRYLYQVIAQRDNCLPSDVKKRREQAGFKQTPKKLTQEEIDIIRQYRDADEQMPISDIAYITGHSEVTVRKYLEPSKEKAES